MAGLMTDLEKFLRRAEQLMARIEDVLPAAVAETDWAASIAFRWRKARGRGYLQPVGHPHGIRLSDLRDIERQKALVDANTRQFVARRPANNVLLTGARGTGKSSLIKACLNGYASKGLRLIEVDKSDLIDLPDIADQLDGRSERFIIFCDDLSFESSESAYKPLKAILDGSIAAPPDNVLIYATSNRRHLMPEYMQENLDTKYLGEEIHPGETVEEKISLSERFGLWVSFYPFDQDAYLDIVEYWLGEFGCRTGEAGQAREAALQWALFRGSRSGRVAWQFARDWAGRQASPQRPAGKRPGSRR
jgi:predicted AAA+ superfamily ATPase